MLEQPNITPDLMMEDLYAIKEQIYQETRNLSPAEEIAWYHRQAQEAAQLMGCTLVPEPGRPGVSRFVHLEPR